jgi:hypothetical protein
MGTGMTPGTIRLGMSYNTILPWSYQHEKEKTIMGTWGFEAFKSDQRLDVVDFLEAYSES